MPGAPADEIIVSADEVRVHLRGNDGPLVTATPPNSNSSSAGDLSFKDVNMSSLAGARTVLTISDTFHVL